MGLDMNVALIGATGFVGSAVLEELVARGHRVTAIARGAKPELNSEYVTWHKSDVYDTEALAKVLAGSEVVINAFNAGWNNPNLYEDYLKGSRSIQSAAKTANVPKLFVVGGAGSLYGDDGTQLVDGPDFPEDYKPGATAARDYLAELAHEAELDWVFLSPPIEFNQAGPTERTGAYRTGGDTPVCNEQGHSIISAPDLALAIVDEVEINGRHRERFTVGY